jgi:hypothetical protein
MLLLCACQCSDHVFHPIATLVLGLPLIALAPISVVSSSAQV